MANTATRLITLIMLLQRQPNQNATQLAQALDVSVRTIQRYITMLDDIGIPVYAERGDATPGNRAVNRRQARSASRRSTWTPAPGASASRPPTGSP